MGLTHGTHFFARPWLSLTTDLGVNFLGPGLSFQRRLGMSQNHKAMSNSCLSTSVCCASWELRCPCTGAGLGWAAPASAAFLWHPKGTCFSISYTGAFPLKDFTVQVLKNWLSWKKKGFSFQTQQISAVTTHPLIRELVGWRGKFAIISSSQGGNPFTSLCWSCWDGSLMCHMFLELLGEPCDPALAPPINPSPSFTLTK